MSGDDDTTGGAIRRAVIAGPGRSNVASLGCRRMATGAGTGRRAGRAGQGRESVATTTPDSLQMFTHVESERATDFVNPRMQAMITLPSLPAGPMSQRHAMTWPRHGRPYDVPVPCPGLSRPGWSALKVKGIGDGLQPRALRSGFSHHVPQPICRSFQRTVVKPCELQQEQSKNLPTHTSGDSTT